jgi:hypothetical protein
MQPYPGVCVSRQQVIINGYWRGKVALASLITVRLLGNRKRVKINLF